MNNADFRKFLSWHKVDRSMCEFWAPEVYIATLHEAVTPDEYAYLESVEKALKEKYGDNWKQILTAATVLVENEHAFKNRIEGKIVDNWLTKATFNAIAAEMVEVLSTDFIVWNDWQIKLRETFRAMIN